MAVEGQDPLTWQHRLRVALGVAQVGPPQQQQQ
jgi:hypothetical protein